jgi:hypothetical protein
VEIIGVKEGVVKPMEGEVKAPYENEIPTQSIACVHRKMNVAEVGNAKIVSEVVFDRGERLVCKSDLNSFDFTDGRRPPPRALPRNQTPSSPHDCRLALRRMCLGDPTRSFEDFGTDGAAGDVQQTEDGAE